jgi:hypothetical protein
MQTSIKKSVTVSSLLVALCATLLSFSINKGSEGFEIYLNNKLVVRQYGNQMNTVKGFQLDQRSYNDELTIKYSHCGRIGKSRNIIIKDEQNRILKEWHFADSKDAANLMSCKVKDILGLKKGNSHVTLNLYYSSSELPGGRLLAIINTENNNTKP